MATQLCFRVQLCLGWQKKSQLLSKNTYCVLFMNEVQRQIQRYTGVSNTVLVLIETSF